MNSDYAMRLFAQLTEAQELLGTNVGGRLSEVSFRRWLDYTKDPNFGPQLLCARFLAFACEPFTQQGIFLGFHGYGTIMSEGKLRLNVQIRRANLSQDGRLIPFCFKNGEPFEVLRDVVSSRYYGNFGNMLPMARCFWLVRPKQDLQLLPLEVTVIDRNFALDRIMLPDGTMVNSLAHCLALSGFWSGAGKPDEPTRAGEVIRSQESIFVLMATGGFFFPGSETRFCLDLTIMRPPVITG
jgi:hypothetical protein